MELHCQLDPESVRKLALRLYGEQALKDDPASVIFSTLNWVDRVIGNTEVGAPVQNDLVRQLGEIARVRELSVVATEIGVSINAVRSWLHGAQPNPVSLEKIKRYLESQLPSIDAAGAEQQPTESGELFAGGPPPTS
jgi:hypothetical protein